MTEFIINGKKLPIPSFFQVYNYGGGCGDKSRELIYADLTNNTPALINYFYTCNKYPHDFASPYFNDLKDFETIGDIYNYIRNKLIHEKDWMYPGYIEQKFNFNSKVMLLDSGASNIVKSIAKDVNYEISKFQERFFEDMILYYDFAHRYKFDIVVGFDLGGKYTFKDDEKKDIELINFYNSLNKDKINKILLQKTTEYMLNHPEYYPKVLATIHGRTPSEYQNYVTYAINLEKETGYRYWGFALGGVASSKGMDKSWKDGITIGRSIKKNAKNALIPAKAIKIVHDIVGDRPIHALGCGGYPNIAMNYFCGATSFDAATPARRVGDGNRLSTKFVFIENPPKNKDVKFSKMFVGGLCTDLSLRTEEFNYITINKVPNNYPLCGCSACNKINSFLDIKNLYANQNDDQAFYYAKQLMNIHAVLQHERLCKKLIRYNNMLDYCEDNPSSLNKQLLDIYKQL